MYVYSFIKNLFLQAIIFFSSSVFFNMFIDACDSNMAVMLFDDDFREEEAFEDVFIEETDKTIFRIGMTCHLLEI